MESDSALATITAFANDIDNLGGGYLVIGAGMKKGKLVYPIQGLCDDEIEAIKKELMQSCTRISPAYMPVVESVIYERKQLLLIWCPGGYCRPYQCPQNLSHKLSEKRYYIRKLAATVEANEYDSKELISLQNYIPFDDRANHKATIDDLKFIYLESYIRHTGSSLIKNLYDRFLSSIAKDMRIVDEIQDCLPVNAGLLFFNDNPEHFFPYARIEIVKIPDPTGDGMIEKVFFGPIHYQLQSALDYIRCTVIEERDFKIDGNAETVRIKNYSYEALKEFICNAVYHKSYQIHEPITIRIEKEFIEITSAPGPDLSISDDDISNYQMGLVDTETDELVNF